MKILTAEEIEAHRYHTLSGGVKGIVAGLLISGAIFKIVPLRYPKFNPKAMTYSVKTAMFITPPTLLAAICGEEASSKFDEIMYSSGAESSQALEEHRRWKNLPFKEKLVEGLSNNRYKLITGAWAASLYGSWVFVNRDPIMTRTQKAVQARMYAQFITVLLLLASMGLSMYEQKLHPNKQKQNEQQRWNKLLQEAEVEEEREKERLKTGFATNQDRINAKIFKYD
ncbi:hypothetical protein HG535_0A07150 [Zygotorulaspora mrakii]|uniref:HIG1 domain-containing protein n=1 Tax=Zygotorulaspora mrakii TaxID=42260 RepID=A0A7H9AX07_ZYGMR|nr:uncharacterized protein HG535_0A07150 [Zygotorulaspora mrakii]QLG70773.1 hypothetical protein HG535_0A07150 [Zygotorulaspora mrakii]